MMKNFENNKDITRTKLPEFKKIESNDLAALFKNFQSNTLLQDFNDRVQKGFQDLPMSENSFGELLANDQVFVNYRDSMVAKISPRLDPKSVESETFRIVNHCSAISMRIIRLRIKFFIILSLHNYSLRRNLALQSKLLRLWESVCNEKLYLESEKSIIQSITFDSTINKIKKTLATAEFNFKSFLIPIASTYDIPHFYDASFYAYQVVTSKFEDITPLGLLGWESDYYYVTRCLFHRNLTLQIFSEPQLKQWIGLEEEILNLLLFFRVGNPANIDLACFLDKETHVMNISFSEFASPKSNNGKCSNEAFSRFITVTSRFIIQLYLLVYKHITPLEIPPENS